MYAPTTIGMLAAMALALTAPTGPAFSLHSTGAVALTAAGSDARYGIVANALGPRSVLLVSLGGPGALGTLHLSVEGDRPPAPGRYPIRPTWDETETGSGFHASFMPGTAGQPLGWFHGESGWVTITESGAGRIAGTFEIEARGFEASAPEQEDRVVTVRGTFEAVGDRGETGVAVSATEGA